MARRYSVSSEKLLELSGLRQAGDSWLGIEEKTGVPRRVAKRAYQEWERKRSDEELSAARREVAADEFRRHLDSLTQLAQLLARSLGVPTSIRDRRDAESVLDDVWKAGLDSVLESYRRQDHGEGESKQREAVRQGRMLLRALQDHTHGKVRWEALDEWKKAWDTSIKKLAELGAEATKILENILEQETGLKDTIIRECGRNDAVSVMTGGILWAVWGEVCEGKPLNSDRPLARTRTSYEGKSEVVFGEHNATHGLMFDEVLAKRVADVCNWADRNLRSGEIVQQVAGELGRMRARSEELEEKLDPLRLRPLMLRSRCDLCPV